MATAGDLESKSIKELRTIIHAAGLRFDDCVEKADLLRRATEALRSQGLRPDDGKLWRRYHVAPGVEVPLLTEPRADAPASAIAKAGATFVTTGKRQEQFAEVLQVLGRSTWVPLRTSAGRELLLPVEEMGHHGDGQEIAGGMETTRAQQALQMLRLRVELKPSAQSLPWPEHGEALIEKNGQKAHLFGPDARSVGAKPGEPLPLMILMHGASKKGPRSPKGWDFAGYVQAYRAARSAAKRNILLLIPEAQDHTWDLITVSGREDMDFLQWAIAEVRRRYAVDDGHIAVAGCSDGGSLCLSLALRNPDLFEAGLSQAAGFCLMEPGLVPQAKRRPRLFMEYGTQDELGFYKNAPQLRAKWASAGYELRFRAIEGGGHGASREFFRDAHRFWLSPPPSRLAEEGVSRFGGKNAVERDWPKGRLSAHNLEKVANFRDVAGIDPTLPVRVRGGWLKRGLLFRSGLWNLATEADIQILREKLKIRTFLDLREPKEDQAMGGAVWDSFPPSPCGKHRGQRSRNPGELRRVACDLLAGLDEDTVGGDADESLNVDLARGRPTSASSVRSSERWAGSAVDGRPDTRWTSIYSDGQWICVDLGVPQAIGRVDVRWEKACADAYRVEGRLETTEEWRDLAPRQRGAEGWVTTELYGGSRARYVRIFGESRATDFGFSIWELCVRPQSEATDLALGRPAAASSEKASDRGAVCAVDGRGHTRWSSLNKDEQWLTVDLGTEMPLGRVEILWEKACAKSYLIEGSTDLEEWVTMAKEEGKEGWVATPLPKGSSARYVRMFGESRATGFGFSIWQLKVYGAEAGGLEAKDLARGRPTKASSSRRPAANAVDSDTHTRWTSEYQDEQWLSVDLGMAMPVSRVELCWEQAHARRYFIEGSLDGESWTRLAEEDGQEGWVVTLLPEGSHARHVRMFGKTRATDFGFSLWHFQVYGGKVPTGKDAAARYWRYAARQHGSASLASYFIDLNKSMLLVNGKALASALRELLEPQNYPLAFGCMQGKDRTGLLSMLVLAALGACEQELQEDYMLSNECTEHNAECTGANSKQFSQKKKAEKAKEGPEPASSGGGEEQQADSAKPAGEGGAAVSGEEAARAGSTGLEGAEEQQESGHAPTFDSQLMQCHREVVEGTLAVLRKAGGVHAYLESIGFGSEKVAQLRSLLVKPF